MENAKQIHISEMYDSREKDTVWHRVVFNNQIMKQNFSVTFYAANSLYAAYAGGTHVADLISDASLSVAEKKEYLKPYLQKEVYGQKDILLHDITGRYVWFLIEYYAETRQEIRPEEIRIYFPKQTWLSHLPEVYAENKESKSFLERYLAIFQSLYEDLNEAVRYSPAYFLPDICNRKFLHLIAGWLNEKKAYLWNEAQLRYLLCHATEFYRCRGTVKSLQQIVELYTGEKPYIVEYHDLERERAGSRKDIILSLYGDDPFSFTMLVKEEHVPGNIEYKTLRKILEDVVPAHISCRLIVIRPYIFLNTHSYMGINSVLSRYKPFDFNHVVILPFSSVSG